MACNYNGQTYVNTCIAAPGATATDATYVVDLTHYTCGNRKICANGAYPVTSDLNYKAVGVPYYWNLHLYALSKRTELWLRMQLPRYGECMGISQRSRFICYRSRHYRWRCDCIPNQYEGLLLYHQRRLPGRIV